MQEKAAPTRLRHYIGWFFLTIILAQPVATAFAFAGPAPIVTTGTDGNTLKVHLEVSPGNVGFNHFTLTVADYVTGSPISDATVTLGFLFNGRESIGTSALPLTSLGKGTFSADGANLSLGGSWNITAQVETTQWMYDVPLQLTTRQPRRLEIGRAHV